ncbi:MAG: glycine--tRNA ligase subunit beta [Pelotomaculum sp.]|uniref:Glycine--tRNA ligase beta subunit n=1 Tax=Pelotomaculum thermopropionicum (strain DSM 13744 / JCM 10971 / SI) TaxID=370438 RepID=A5D3T9_PELTS|nr:glycine--tRNA ligase subunit beta [Pelotomaculum sp.]BAF59081.1 glycyl-tRNA synthetase, beta subunit [Pelotomaculum thermopropionicum SI]
MSARARDYLLEIGVEELPARFLDPALAELKEISVRALAEKRLSCKKVETFGTPRRLALYVEGLAEHQEPLETEVKGPAVKVAFKPDGTPTRAAEGFARSQGVAVSGLVRKFVGHVEYVFAVKREEGRPAREVLSEIAPALIDGLHFPKPMRWGNLEVRFARPIRWIVSLFGDEVVEFEYAGLKAGRTTCGHRFLSKEPVVLAFSSEYFEKMRSNYVIVDTAERRQLIRRQVQELAASAGGRAEEDEDLLNEVSNLVEYPTALVGEFSPDYLNLPREVLVTPMREHQRYFPVVSPDGGLLPKFIAVKNGAPDHLDIIRSGYEKVLRARLADANFFFQEDLKTPLAGKVPALKKVIFQESLGTVYDKVERLGALAGYLAGVMGAGRQEKEVALRAAYLAKADLVTSMVYEFPELQGIMGREYALRSGESREVAEAVFEHYLPRFAGDRLPETLPGKILSIADKIDNIVGCFAIGIQPSGSQDPYALRRQALGISHIILEGQAALSLRELVETAYRGYEGKVELKCSLEKVTADVGEFFEQRLRSILGARGFSYDTVEAVLASGCDDFADTLLRAQALAGFRRDPAFGDLLTVFVRANNLARNAFPGQVNPALLEDASEKELNRRLAGVQEEAKRHLEKKDYRSLLAGIATLQKPLEEFFNSVMVMVEDREVRENRLTLLANLAGLVRQVADLSKIVVETG